MSSTKENLRVMPKYKNTSEKYRLSSNDYQINLYYRQYFLVYRTRLNLLRQRLLDQANRELGHDVEPLELDKLAHGKKSLIIGVLIKKSKKRPSVLTEFELPNFRRESEEVDGEDEEMEDKITIYDSVCSVEDKIELEYSKQRITLCGEIDKDDYVTGYVVGLYGSRTSDDLFSVDKVIYPELAPQVEWPMSVEETYVMFLSGVGMDSDMTRNETTLLALTQLLDWIYGCSSDEEVELARKVSRIVFAGDSVQISSREIGDFKITKIGQKMNFEPTALEQLDRVIENFVRTIPVDLMSGPNDICDPMLPQQPMVVRAFDKCYRYGNEMFNLVTNPYSFEIDGVQFLGTSGQNVHDLLKYTRGHPPLAIMRQFIQLSYLLPTCPDTLDGFPLQDHDPFVIEQIPHVFFAGNQTDYEVEKCTFENGARALLMTIPKFSQRHEAVLLNVKTLETQVFRFDQALMG